MKPNHIGIIPDGNRRWAKIGGISEYLAHTTSGNYNNLLGLLNAAEKEGIKIFSLWAFSTENWKRNKGEINELFDVIERVVDNFNIAASQNKYKFIVIGRKEKLPVQLYHKIEKLEKITKNYTRMLVVVGVDYGGRDEILRAVNKAILRGKELDEKNFSKYLDTAGIPDQDLIIRTGGEKRLSGYMPFQSIYSELIFTDILFPDFTPKNLIEIIKEFEKRKRQFGE
jgi:undecaprenyl diphosphate synthase